MYAIVATGGKQYTVAAGDEVVVEKVDAAVGESVSFDVIFLADDGEITVDADALSRATVTAEVLEHFKGEKAVIFKFKKRKGYKRLKGHRQDLTRVRITEVRPGGSKRSASKKSESVDGAAAETAEVAAAPASE